VAKETRDNFLKDLLVRGLQPSDLARHLVLTGCELLNDVLQRGKIQRDLMDLVRVDGGGDGRIRGHRRWRSLHNRWRLRRHRRRRPSGSVIGTDPTRDQPLGVRDHPSFEAFVAIICLAPSP
jgi:hypothetical protein